MATNPYINLTNVGTEQRLVEDITVELIQGMGQDCYYIPRIYFHIDKLFGEDPTTSFEKTYKIEMYIQSYKGFDGTDVISQFGLEIKDKISKLFSEDLFIGPGNSFVRLLKGAVWGEHSDDYEFKEIIEKSKNYKEGDSYTEETVPVYGLIVYFNNFEGGQIYYPKQNVTYHPKPGDLLIHSSLEHCLHGVKEVKSDVRYSYSNNIRKKIKVPVDGV